MARAPGDVRDGGVHGDDEIEGLNQRGGVGEVVPPVCQVDQTAGRRHGAAVPFRNPLLQRDEAHARHVEEGSPCGQARRSPPIAWMRGVARPRNAHPRQAGWRPRVEPGLPRGNSRRIDRQVRHGAGDGVQRRAQQEREARHDAEDVDGSGVFIARDDPRHARGASQKVGQLRRCGQDHLATSLGDQGNEASELDGVARALVSHQQNASPWQPHAVPGRDRQAGHAIDAAFQTPVPIELGQSWPELPATHQEAAELEVHQRHPRSDRRRLRAGRPALRRVGGRARVEARGDAAVAPGPRCCRRTARVSPRSLLRGRSSSPDSRQPG